MLCLKSGIGPRHSHKGKKMGESEFRSYVAEHLLIPRETKQSGLPLEGSIVHILEDVDKEWQEKEKIRCFRSHDDQKYMVDEDHFKQFCTSPQLDENIEEGIMSSAESRSQKSAMPYKFNNKAFDSTNNELKKNRHELKTIAKTNFIWLIDYYILRQNSILRGQARGYSGSISAFPVNG